MKLIDLTGKTFGNLTVIKRHGDCTPPKWECKCLCGSTKMIYGDNLKRGTKSCGCLSKKHFIDLTGLKFNKLYIKKHLGKNINKNNIYECKCDCGKVIVAEGSDVKTGKIKSCGCGQIDHWIKHCKENPYYSIKNQIYNLYKSSAKKRKIDFNISKEEFFPIIEKNCHYCGTPPVNFRNLKNKANGQYMFLYNGVDRRNNDLGYNKENTVPCCNICNMAKRSLTEEFFLEWAKKIHTYQLTKERDK